MDPEVRRTQAAQDGVISRKQALQLGLTPPDIRRLIRRRDWARIHPGVYVDHTGRLTWRQRAWAAVLYAAPAALAGESALRAADGPGRRDVDESGPVHVAVDTRRTVVTPPGITLHRMTEFDSRVQWNLSPPRVRVEHAVLDLAADASDDFAAIAVLADAMQSRRTTPARLRASLERRNRIARRDFLADVLHDVDAGACSVLEHAFLTRVERAHRLPRAARQVRASSRGPVYRDVHYEALGLVVELDGLLDHTRTGDRARDLDRDLDALTGGDLTVRLGWGQVVGWPCRTAARLAQVMQRLGWAGSLRPCPRCRIAEVVDFRSPGDSKSTRSA